MSAHGTGMYVVVDTNGERYEYESFGITDAVGTYYEAQGIWAPPVIAVFLAHNEHVGEL